MQPWYLSELDFIYAVYGAAFMILGGVCVLLSSHGTKSPLNWFWLAAFAFLHGLNEWFDYVALVFSSNPYFDMARYALLLLSFLALMEFGRVNSVLRERLSPFKLYSVVLGALALCTVLNPTHYDCFVRYLVGFPGALLAGVALLAVWRAGRSRALFFSGLLLCLYAVAAGLFVKGGLFFPSSLLNEALFVSLFSIPVQLCRSALALGLAFCVWCHLREISFESIWRKAGGPFRVVAGQVGIACLCLLIIGGGWLLTRAIGQRQARELRGNILSLAQALASSIEQPQFMHLKGVPSEKDSPVLRHLLNHFQSIVNEQKYIATLYLMGERNGHIFFFLDAQSVYYPRVLPPGQPGDPYLSAAPVFFTVLREGKALVVGPVKDDWGHWVSALVPIRHPDTGKVIALLGVDLDAASYMAHIGFMRAIGILITIFTLFLVVLFLLVQYKMRESREMLASSEKRYKNMVHQNKLVMMLVDAENGTIYEVNEAAANYYGYPEEKLLAMRVPELVSGYNWDEVLARGRRIVELKGHVFPSRHILASGEVRDVELYGVPIELDKTYIFLVVVDVAERVRAQKALTERIDFLRLLVETIPLPFYVKDMEGHYIDCNSAFAEFVGESKESLCTKGVTDIQPPEQAAFYMEKDREILSSPKGVQQFNTEVRIAGKRAFMSFNRAVFRNADGTVGGILGLIKDTTELVQARKNAEDANEQLKEANVELERAMAQESALASRAEAGSRAKTEFLTMMSHEIRTPLNSIIGFTELLLTSDLKGRQREFMEAVYDSGRSLLVLISDILDLSKIEAGKLDLEKRPFLLAKCLADVAQMLSVRVQEKKLDPVVWNVGPGVPEVLVSDYGRLTQVLLNLAGNAIKFTETGGVKIFVSCLRKEELQAYTIYELEFSVQDTGPGIEPQVLGQLFQPFTQGDSSTTRKFGGTGLGLAISKKLCELLDGRIWAESAPGAGSTFHFTIQAQGRGASETELSCRASADPLGNHASLRSSRILAVEDNPINRKLLASILEKMGHCAEFATSGRTAVDMARRGGYDLILMDLEMPEMDGFDAARRIREEERRADTIIVPIVALTAHATTGDRRRCMECGMQDYLSKPVVFRDLSDTLARWIEPNFPLLVLCASAPASLHIERCLSCLDGISPHFITLRDNAVPTLWRKHFVSVMADTVALDAGLLAGFMRQARENGRVSALPFTAITKEWQSDHEELFRSMGFACVVPCGDLPVHVASLVTALKNNKPRC